MREVRYIEEFQRGEVVNGHVKPPSPPQRKLTKERTLYDNAREPAV